MGMCCASECFISCFYPSFSSSTMSFSSPTTAHRTSLTCAPSRYLNVLQPTLVARPDPSTTSSARVANISKFVTAAVTFGVPRDEVFERKDLEEGGLRGLARVAACVVAVERVRTEKEMGGNVRSEKTNRDEGKVSAKGGEVRSKASPPPASSRSAINKSSSTGVAGISTTAVYSAHPVGSVSTPNLLATRSASPGSQGVMKQQPLIQIQKQKQKQQKRWTPPGPGLATVRSASPVDAGGRASGESERGRDRGDEDEDVFGPMEFVDSSGALGSPHRAGARTSIASSSQATDTTNAHSSLFDPHSSMHTRYGTIRTVTTEATSLGTDIPSLTRTEASAIAMDLDVANPPHRSRSSGALASHGACTDESSPRRRDRKVSDGAGVVDLSRVAEETEEGSIGQHAPALPPRSPSRDKAPPIRLGKGKWPDDFMSAFQYPAKRSPAQIPEGGETEQPAPDNPLSPSGSPPRQRVRRSSNSVDLTPLASSEAAEPITASPLGGRPKRRLSRHSADVLLPKEVSLAIGRDSSPSSSRDSSTPSPGGAAPGSSRQPILRRSSTRTYAPRTTSPSAHDRSTPDASLPVPFPRSRSGESTALVALPSSSETLLGETTSTTSGGPTRSPYQRARHRSEVDHGNGMSDDQSAQRLAGRSRFESMVNLGGATDFTRGETSLIGGMDGSAVRKTLVVKEEGKPATHYVSSGAQAQARSSVLGQLIYHHPFSSNSETA